MLKSDSKNGLKSQIKKKKAELEVLEEKLEKKSWPKKTALFLHGDKEDNYDNALELGLSDDAFEKTFCRALYEITFDISVNQDGTYIIDEIHEGDNVFVPKEV